MDDGPRNCTFGGENFLGIRSMNNKDDVSFIQISDKETCQPVAKVTYDPRDGAMAIITFKKAVSRCIIEGLFQRADNFLV